MMLLTLVPVTALASTGGIEVKSIEYAGEQPVKLEVERGSGQNRLLE